MDECGNYDTKGGGGISFRRKEVIITVKGERSSDVQARCEQEDADLQEELSRRHVISVRNQLRDERAELSSLRDRLLREHTQFCKT